MSNRYLKNNTKAKKGISPVIATVILVAVAVVIAAALAGFSSSLFGSYSQSGQVSIRTATLVDDGTGSIDMVNRGGADESVTRVSVTNFGTLTDDGAGTDIFVGATGTAPIIPANGDALVEFADITAGGTPPVAGQAVTMTVTTASGQQYTISVTVSS